MKKQSFIVGRGGQTFSSPYQSLGFSNGRTTTTLGITHPAIAMKLCKVPTGVCRELLVGETQPTLTLCVRRLPYLSFRSDYR